MFENYGDQLYIDLSWVVFDDYVLPNLETWVKLIERHPDRFMIGSDVVGVVSGMDRALCPYDKLLKVPPRGNPPEGRSRQLRGSLRRNGPKKSRRRAGRKRNRPPSKLRVLREGPRSPPLQGNPLHGRENGESLIQMKFEANPEDRSESTRLRVRQKGEKCSLKRSSTCLIFSNASRLRNILTALLTPKNPFCHCIILNLKWY